MKVSYLGLLICFIIMITACQQKKKIDPKFDDSLYTTLQYPFYKGKDGKMYIKTSVFEKTNDTTKKIVYFYKEVPTVHIKTYTQLQHGGFYAKDTNHIYAWENTLAGESLRVVEGANPQSFTCIGYLWGKDNNAVYYAGNKIKELNPNQLISVCSEVVDSTLIYIKYMRDNTHLFYQETEIKVPNGIDITKIYCKEDLMGNPYLAYGNNIYIVTKGAMVLYQ